MGFIHPTLRMLLILISISSTHRAHASISSTHALTPKLSQSTEIRFQTGYINPKDLKFFENSEIEIASIL